MIDFGPHNLTQSNSPLPWVVYASSFYGQENPWKAFNGSIDWWNSLYGYYQNWWTANGPTGWIKLDCGSGISHILVAYRIQLDMTGSMTYAPKSWTVEGSNDNENWDILDTVVNEIPWPILAESRLYTCDVATTAYRYFRLNFSANQGGAYLRIGEISLYRDIEEEEGEVDDPEFPAVNITQHVIEPSISKDVDLNVTQHNIEAGIARTIPLNITQNNIEVSIARAIPLNITQFCIEVAYIAESMFYTDRSTSRSCRFSW